jgi:hypothetical protein
MGELICDKAGGRQPAVADIERESLLRSSRPETQIPKLRLHRLRRERQRAEGGEEREKAQ